MNTLSLIIFGILCFQFGRGLTNSAHKHHKLEREQQKWVILYWAYDVSFFAISTYLLFKYFPI